MQQKSNIRPAAPQPTIHSAMEVVKKIDASMFKRHRTNIHRCIMEAIVDQGGMSLFSIQDQELLDIVDKWLVVLAKRNGSDAGDTTDQLRRGFEGITITEAKEMIGEDGYTQSQRDKMVAGALDIR